MLRSIGCPLLTDWSPRGGGEASGGSAVAKVKTCVWLSSACLFFCCLCLFCDGQIVGDGWWAFCLLELWRVGRGSHLRIEGAPSHQRKLVDSGKTMHVNADGTFKIDPGSNITRRAPRCLTRSLTSQRTLPAIPSSWRAHSRSEHNEPVTFYLHETGGADFSGVARVLRSIIGRGRMAEEVIPIAYSQYLVDLPLIEALAAHPQRTLNRSAASWHILAAMPFASRLLCLLQANVTADGKHTCDRRGRCRLLPRHELMAPPLAAHRMRLHMLASYLQADADWQTPNVPFLLLSTGIDIGHDLTDNLLATLLARNANVGPVLLAGVDRSGPHGSIKANRPLLKRMIVLPHVASPECALRAWQAASHIAAKALLPSEKRQQGRRREPRDAITASTRTGFVFHGDDGRFDCAHALMTEPRMPCAPRHTGMPSPAHCTRMSPVH